MILLRYKTSYWIPPIAEITLRTERNDWKDLTGRYEEGGWTFELPAETFAGTWEAKLVLDRDGVDERSKPHLHGGRRRNA